ncbi:MAG TPA: hypothetical protein DDW52_06820 [Planctomycetaceae bacterium]|nr:hypothetical protein [Planctomycetaceae bacterium]
MSADIGQTQEVTASGDQEKRHATVKLKFQYRGGPPKYSDLSGAKDPFCACCRIPDERLLVGPDGGLSNVALIWDERRNEKLRPTSFPPTDKEQLVRIRHEGCRFIPRITVVQSGQTLVVDNLDAVGHNTRILFLNDSPEGRLVPVGSPFKRTIRSTETAPLPVECTIHPWEKAWVIVRDHPYIGVSDTKGELTIKRMPIGRTYFKIWHESLRLISSSQVKLNGRQVRLERGRIIFELKPGMNDLGTIQVDERHLRKTD